MDLYSYDAEASLVGAAMLDASIIADAADLVRPEDMGEPAHRLLWGAIINLSAKGQGVDAVSVSEHLEAAGQADEAGGLAGIAELVRQTPGSSNAMTYAGIVAELAQRRAIIQTVLEVEQSARGRETPLVEIVDAAKARIEGCLRTGHDRLPSAKEALGEVIDRLDRRFNGDEAVMGSSTGIKELDEKLMGLQPGLIIIGARPSMGKAQPLDAKVLARHGWVRMGDVQVGDELASVDGKPSFVTGVYPQGRKAIYRVTLSDGRSTRACGEHLWRVNYRDWQAPRVVSTEKLIEMLGSKRYRNRMWVEAYQGDHGHDAGLPLPPWVVGAMIANGNTTNGTPRISTGDRENVAKLLRLMEGVVSATFDGRSTYSLPSESGKNRLAEGLKQIGLWGSLSFEKRIPAPYLEATRDDRIALLAGLIDNDGWVEKFGAVLYSTSSPGLAEDVRYLVRSLGGVCNISTKTPRYRTAEGDLAEGRQHYTCSISLPCYRGVVTLERKARRIRDAKKGRQKRLNVASVEYVGDEQAQCIAVSHPEHLYVTDDFIVTHNTAMMLQCAVQAATNDAPTLIASMEMRSRALMERMLCNIGNLPIMAFRNPQEELHDEHWPRITMAVNTLQQAPLYIDDKPSQTVAHLRARAKEVFQAHGKVGLICVDYVQKMRASGEYGARHDRAMEEIIVGLNDLGKEYGCPVLVLAQLNRKVEERPNKRPIMSDLKESSAFEQEADVIGFLYRDEVYNPDNPDNHGLAEIIIAKQREGETGTVHCAARLGHGRFDNLAPAPYAAKSGFDS